MSNKLLLFFFNLFYRKSSINKVINIPSSYSDHIKNPLKKVKV